jgi:Flp pilus assembly protein TadG
MMTPAGRFKSREKGATAVESAVIALFFLGLLLGTMEVGRMLSSFHMVGNLAREGTRYALVHGEDSSQTATTSSVQNYVRGKAGGTTPQHISVTTTWTPDKERGSRVKVEVQYTFQSILPFIPNWPMSSSSEAVISF